MAFPTVVDTNGKYLSQELAPAVHSQKVGDKQQVRAITLSWSQPLTLGLIIYEAELDAPGLAPCDCKSMDPEACVY